VIFLLSVFIIAGISGFFIPFSDFSADAVKQNQRRNMAAQNRKLSARMHTARRMLRNLDEKILRITQQKEKVTPYITIPLTRQTLPGRSMTVDMKHLDQVVRYLDEIEELYIGILKDDRNGSSVFDRVPVLVPVAGAYSVTSVFGKMTDPFTETEKFHSGLDLAARQETPVVAAADGIVTLSEKHLRWGKRIRIRHACGFSTVYAHLGTVNVVTGQKVLRGQRIAGVGISGVTTGPHLHYEVWKDNSPVDPLIYMVPAGAFASADRVEKGS
jgi:murein DD-endopeptidase MepM/ murein hydrolase activator NlpD